MDLRYLADPYWLYNKVLFFYFTVLLSLLNLLMLFFGWCLGRISSLLSSAKLTDLIQKKKMSDYKSDIIMWWSLAGVSFASRIWLNDLPLINISSNLESSGVSAETEGVMKSLPHSLLPCFFLIPACYRLLLQIANISPFCFFVTVQVKLHLFSVFISVNCVCLALQGLLFFLRAMMLGFTRVHPVSSWIFMSSNSFHTVE